MWTQGDRKRKENYWMKVNYKTGYASKEYRLPNRYTTIQHSTLISGELKNELHILKKFFVNYHTFMTPPSFIFSS